MSERGIIPASRTISAPHARYKLYRNRMSIRIIGMIGVTPPSSDATLHVIEGGLSPSYVTEAARAHDEAGFDLVLVGYSS